MYSCAGTEYSYQLSTLDLIITYFHSGTTFGKELKRGKRKMHVCYTIMSRF
jgi:hypothetical protein